MGDQSATSDHAHLDEMIREPKSKDDDHAKTITAFQGERGNKTNRVP